MICPDGSIRIMDFGIAHSVDSRRLTFTCSAPARRTTDGYRNA